MYNLSYHHFLTLNETLSFIADREEYCLIAGGTDVVIQYRAGKRKERDLVDLLIPELTGISEDDEYYVIGSSTTLTDVSDYFAQQPQPYYMLSKAAASVGSCQTRNLATVGGNICTGNASSDMAAAFLVMDAKAVIAGLAYERTINMDAFFVSNRKLALEKGEVLKSILIPKFSFAGSGADFAKLGKRRGHVIATLNVSAMVAWNEMNVITHARLAGGTLAPTPIRFYESEKLLLGCEKTGQSLNDAIKAVQECMTKEMQPRDSRRGSKEYRMEASTAVMADIIMAVCGEKG